LFSLILYFLPTIIALWRGVNMGKVFLLDLFLGWSIWGYIISLGWAMGMVDRDNKIGGKEKVRTTRLERLGSGGSYVTSDKRFIVQRTVWQIIDTAGEFTFDAPVYTLRDADRSIAKKLRDNR
jgi:Superinfection immunity protein